MPSGFRCTYATSLSADAVPSLVAALPSLNRTNVALLQRGCSPDGLLSNTGTGGREAGRGAKPGGLYSRTVRSCGALPSGRRIRGPSIHQSREVNQDE